MFSYVVWLAQAKHMLYKPQASARILHHDMCHLLLSFSSMKSCLLLIRATDNLQRVRTRVLELDPQRPPTRLAPSFGDNSSFSWGLMVVFQMSHHPVRGAIWVGHLHRLTSMVTTTSMIVWTEKNHTSILIGTFILPIWGYIYLPFFCLSWHISSSPCSGPFWAQWICLFFYKVIF